MQYPILRYTSIHVIRPNNIITSAVAADLSSHPSVRGNNKSLGTVTGLINGCGSITASIGLLAVGPLQATFGWSSVWLFLMGATATGTILLSSKIKEELFPAPAGYAGA
jgi:sugar phosphate permease